MKKRTNYFTWLMAIITVGIICLHGTLYFLSCWNDWRKDHVLYEKLERIGNSHSWTQELIDQVNDMGDLVEEKSGQNAVYSFCVLSSKTLSGVIMRKLVVLLLCAFLIVDIATIAAAFLIILVKRKFFAKIIRFKRRMRKFMKRAN